MTTKVPRKRDAHNGEPRRRGQIFVASGPLPEPRELLSAGIEIDASNEMERQTRLEALKYELNQMAVQGRFDDALDRMLGVVVDLERENERLSWRLLRALRYRFGRSTEKLSGEQLKQLYLALGGTDYANPPASGLTVPAPVPPVESETVATDETSPADQKPAKKKRNRKRGGATIIGPNVERDIKPVVPVPAEERICALCGAEKKTIGHVTHERIEFVPAKVVVNVELREKCACTVCRKDVSVAERTEAPAVIRKVAPSMLSKLLTDKCSMSLPLDRQRRKIARYGVDMPSQTLASYWAYTTDLLAPVSNATLSTVFGFKIVGADDSTLKTLNPNAKQGTFRAHLWCFVGTDGSVGGREMVGYGYAPSWNASEIADWFSAIDGWIQCDAYAGYSTQTETEDDGSPVIAVPDERRLGCGMHIRSKFHAALLAKDRRAAIPLKYFHDLYKIEAACRDRGLDAQAREEVRHRDSLPILNEFDCWVDDVHSTLLPKSPLRRATQYAINQRAFFRRCFDRGIFEIDNGRTERRLRNFAVGRRNFLFTGSERGGHRLATAYTLVDNCSILGIDPRLYLEDVITKLERGWPMSRLSELIPNRWAIEHTRQDRSE